MNLIKNKKIDLIVKIKNNRIWLPKHVQNIIGDEFIEVRIKNICFITKLTKDGRFFIRKKIGKRFPNKQSRIQVIILKNLDRSKKFISKNRVDILAFVPKKTLSGYNILALEKKDKIELWYSTKGGPNEIKINRFVPIYILRLLGYWQAEGGKLKLKKRRGREFNFTNKSIKIILDFLRLSENLIDPSLWRVSIRHNPSLPKKEITKISNILKKREITKIKIKPAERIKTFTIKLWISNSLLAETLSNMVNFFRKYLIKSEINRVNEKLLIYFLQGLLAGDGSFFSKRDKYGSLHSRMSVYESNLNYIEDYKNLLNKLNINGHIRKEKNKNLYIFTAYTNWKTLLTLREKELFEYSENNKNKIINAINNHRGYKHE